MPRQLAQVGRLGPRGSVGEAVLPFVRPTKMPRGQAVSAEKASEDLAPCRSRLLQASDTATVAGVCIQDVDGVHRSPPISRCRRGIDPILSIVKCGLPLNKADLAMHDGRRIFH